MLASALSFGNSGRVPALLLSRLQFSMHAIRLFYRSWTRKRAVLEVRIEFGKRDHGSESRISFDTIAICESNDRIAF